MYLGKIENEKRHSENLLRNILPTEIVTRLRNGESNIADHARISQVTLDDLQHMIADRKNPGRAHTGSNITASRRSNSLPTISRSRPFAERRAPPASFFARPDFLAHRTSNDAATSLLTNLTSALCSHDA
jgi:hypothetical protein